MPSACAVTSTVSVSRNCVSDIPSFYVEIEPIGDTLGLAECVRIPVPPLLADHRDSSDASIATDTTAVVSEALSALDYKRFRLRGKETSIGATQLDPSRHHSLSASVVVERLQEH